MMPAKNLKGDKMDIKKLQDIPSWEWPENADAIILETLKSHDAEASDRLLAAELAGDMTVIDDKLAEAMLSVAKNANEPEEIRTQAVISLGPVLEYTYDEVDDPQDLAISMEMFRKIQTVLRKLYMDASNPKELRRRTLEASVRAPEDWHREAIDAAWQDNDDDWNLTAVFSMGYIAGFDDQIIEALDSKNEDIYYEAIRASGAWGLDEAWSDIEAILTAKESDKYLLLAAIEASVSIRPEEAAMILSDLSCDEDEEIAEAAQEAIALSGLYVEDDFDDDDGDKTIH
jgi:hypothetical protein